MKKMTLKMRLLGGLVAVSMLFVAGSCAQGADCDEVFSAGVTNAQLESPILDGSNFTILDTEEGYKLQISWPVVYGAGGYEVKVANAAEPETFLMDTLLDGCTVMVPVVEDNSYAVSIKTAGNAKYNNKAAETTSTHVFNVMGTKLQIPSGEEISSYIAANPLTPAVPSLGLRYELEAGGTYTLEGTVDFNLNKVKVVGDAERRPTVTIKSDGCFMTSAGLQVKDINFDCIERTSKGIITFSTTQDPSLLNQNMGLSGISRDAHLIMAPIVIQNCNFKDVSNSFIFNNEKNWALYDLRIVNCIIQFAYDGSNPMVVHFKKGNYSHICYFTIQNSTIFNTKDTKCVWVQYASNQNPDKIFGSLEKNKSYYLLENSTFHNPNTTDYGGNMVNNTPNTGTHNIYWYNNIFYNQNNPSKWIGSCKSKYTNNTVYRHDGNDKKYDADVIASGDVSTGTPEDPAFEGPIQSLDLSQPNGGVSFKPTGANALAGRRGDPRWLN